MVKELLECEKMGNFKRKGHARNPPYKKRPLRNILILRPGVGGHYRQKRKNN